MLLHMNTNDAWAAKKVAELLRRLQELADIGLYF